MSDDSAMQNGTRAEPQSLRGRALAVGLTVNDLQKSIEWYRDIAGFTIAEEFEWKGEVRAVALVAGNVRILLTQDDGAKGWDRVKGEGLSLQITTAQDVDEIAQRIRNAGGTLLDEPTDMHWGTRAFRLQDPDGFTIAISTERAGTGE